LIVFCKNILTRDFPDIFPTFLHDVSTYLHEQISHVCPLKIERLSCTQLDDFTTYQLASFYILLPVAEMLPCQMALAENVSYYTHLPFPSTCVRTLHKTLLSCDNFNRTNFSTLFFLLVLIISRKIVLCIDKTVTIKSLVYLLKKYNCSNYPINCPFKSKCISSIEFFNRQQQNTHISLSYNKLY